MMSNHKWKNEKSLYIQAIEQLLININLNYFTYKIRLRYQKSILQSRSSFLPSYCILMEKDWEMDGLKKLGRGMDGGKIGRRVDGKKTERRIRPLEGERN